MKADYIRAEWPAPSNVTAGTTLRDSSFEIPGEPQWLKQVHGIRVVRVGSSDFAGDAPDADAVIASRSGDVCVIRTADCLPILLCSIDGTEVAAVHAGWRGLASGIVEATIAAMTSVPAELIAWFGPAISQAAFEVGGEVRDVFLAANPESASCFVANERGRWQADLYGLARQRLQSAGVSAVYGGGFCTFADEGRFFSYRRDSDCGRLVSFVRLG